MRLSLLGGTGFIGSQVATQLLAAGHQVWILHRGKHEPPPGAESAVADRANLPAWQSAWDAFRPGVMIDLSSYTARDVRQIAPLLRHSLHRVVVLSSGDVYASYGAFLGIEAIPERRQSVANSEAAPRRGARYPYRSQATGPDDIRHDYDKIVVEEEYRKATGAPVTVLRLPMVYGVGDPQGRISNDLARLRQAPRDGLVLNPDEAGWRCTRGYVVDVAAAIVLAALHPGASGKVYNVGESQAWTTRDWLALLAAQAGLQVSIRESPGAPAAFPANWKASVTMDTTRLPAELGFRERVGVAEGVRRTVSASTG
jgi:nucleoside-diphosphate-sugar epimerase